MDTQPRKEQLAAVAKHWNRMAEGCKQIGQLPLRRVFEKRAKDASEADGARGTWTEKGITRIQAQIEELEARRDDEMGGGRWER